MLADNYLKETFVGTLKHTFPKRSNNTKVSDKIKECFLVFKNKEFIKKTEINVASFNQNVNV